MGKISRFDCYPSDFLNGLIGMSADEIAIYTIVIMLIYDRGAPIAYEGRERELQARAGLSRNRLKKAVDNLVEIGKLSLVSGALTNARAELEIQKFREKISKNRENSQKGGDSTKQKWYTKSNEINSRGGPIGQPTLGSARARPSPSPLIDSSLRSESILSKISNDIFSSSAGPDDGALSARKPEKANGHAERELILDLVDIWNTEAPAMGLPAVRNITPTRQSALKARVADFAEDGIAPQDGMRDLMAKIRGSPFLRGTTREGFRATFDFAMKSSTFHRIMEGSYAPKGT